jgi:hypothetical protein
MQATDDTDKHYSRSLFIRAIRVIRGLFFRVPYILPVLPATLLLPYFLKNSACEDDVADRSRCREAALRLHFPARPL